MADTWLSYEAFAERYPAVSLTAETFAALAAEAAMDIEVATHWRAAIATDEESVAALAEAQAQLVYMATGAGDIAARAGSAAVASVSNHGYSETYVRGSEMAAYITTERRRIVYAVLSRPATNWMLYAGGVYHPARHR